MNAEEGREWLHYWEKCKKHAKDLGFCVSLDFDPMGNRIISVSVPNKHLILGFYENPYQALAFLKGYSKGVKAEEEKKPTGSSPLLKVFEVYLPMEVFLYHNQAFLTTEDQEEIRNLPKGGDFLVTDEDDNPMYPVERVS